MKAILISIKPKWVANILSRRKTLEIRKTAPKCDLPIDVYIYCTKGDYIGHISNRYIGKVVAKFTLKKVERLVMQRGSTGWPFGHGRYGLGNIGYGFVGGEEFRWLDDDNGSCLTADDIWRYLGGKIGYAWHIDDLVIFDKPKPLSDFGLKRVPQSWQYMEVEE